MNLQLSTLEEAEKFKKLLDNAGVGGGVVDIYIPEYLGPYNPPSEGDKKFWHFKFANGKEGFNVGLIREFSKWSRFSWISIVASEVNAKSPWEID